jgi:hypothetical protein
MAITLPTPVGNTGTNDWADVYNNDAQLAAEIDDRDGNYQTVFSAACVVQDSQVPAATHYFTTGYGVPVASGTGISLANIFGPPLLGLRAADFAVSSKTAKLRVVGVFASNATALGTSLTIGLYPVTSAGAADVFTLTLGTVTSGSTSAITTPSASTVGVYTGTDFSLPSDGGYTLGFAAAAAAANNHIGNLSLMLQVRWV